MGNPRIGNPDHKRKYNVPAPENKVMAQVLSELLTPLVYRQLSYYKQLGLRQRILGLPLMIAAVLTLQGLANDLIAYLTSPLNLDLGIVKYQSKSRIRNVLDFSPYPDLTKAQSP